MVNWRPERFEDFHTACVKFLSDRQPYPRSALANIMCPVNMVHCSGDIAYRFAGVEALKNRLEEAGVDVQLNIVKDSSHFGSVAHARQ
jgi:dienelactone hydrolase